MHCEMVVMTLAGGETLSSTAAASSTIDFTRSIPPLPPELAPRLVESFTSIVRQQDLSSVLRNGVAGGSERDRHAGALWLAPRLGAVPEIDRVIVANGTQGVLLLLLAHYLQPGEVVLTERLSYGVLKALVTRSGRRLFGLELDDEGILPQAFEDACRTMKPKLLYCNPTVHNPTTAIMSCQRRLIIADIARRYGVVIVEDDPLGRLHPDAPLSIAAVAPDVTWYIMSTTKCLMHGMRIAYAIGPSAKETASVRDPVSRLSHWFPSPLSTSFLNDWIESGAAAELSGSIRAESLRRQDIALRTLRDLPVASAEGSMHLWIVLGDHLQCNDVKARLQENGVLVRSADDFAVDQQCRPNGVRLSVSSPPNRAAVKMGLDLVAQVLSADMQ